MSEITCPQTAAVIAHVDMQAGDADVERCLDDIVAVVHQLLEERAHPDSDVARSLLRVPPGSGRLRATISPPSDLASDETDAS